MESAVIPCKSLIRLANTAERTRIREQIDDPEVPLSRILQKYNGVLGDHNSILMALEFSTDISRQNIELVELVEDHNKFNPLLLEDLISIQLTISKMTLMLAGFNIMITKRITEIKEKEGF
jgi:hypothetical protein